MAWTSNCSIGVHMNEEGHKTPYSSQIGSKHIDMFVEEDQLLIEMVFTNSEVVFFVALCLYMLLLLDLCCPHLEQYAALRVLSDRKCLEPILRGLAYWFGLLLYLLCHIHIQ